MSTNDFYAEGALDIARPPKAVLIDRLNAINGLELNPDHFELGFPIAEAGENYNTYIWVMPVASSAWSSGIKAFYTRLPMPEVMQHAAEVKTNGATTLYAILEAINAAYGIYLVEADVFDEVINYSTPGDTASNGTVRIRIRSTSVFFMGEFTIPVNNSVAHGIGTYDEEMLHFLALRPTVGQDTIKAYNELGEVEANFNYLSNVTIQQSQIRTMWKRTDGTLIVLGSFQFVHTTELNESTTYNRKILLLDRSGKAATSSAGNLYGVDFTGLKYVPDFANDRVYVIDVGNEIGGNTSGLHAYTDQGAYDSSFVSGVSAAVRSVAPYEDKLYVTSQVGDNPPVLRRLLANGTIDPDFTPVSLTVASAREGIDVSRVASITAGESGVSIVLSLELATGAEAEPAWADWSRNQQPGGIAAPVLHYGHDGSKNTAIGKAHELLTSNRTGAGYQNSIVANNSSVVMYSAYLVNPTTGQLGEGIGAIQLDGKISSACTQAVSEQYPAFRNIVAIIPMVRNDVVVGANVQLEDNLGVQNAAGVYFFSYDGYFATQEVVVPGHRLLAMASHLFQ